MAFLRSKIQEFIQMKTSLNLFPTYTWYNHLFNSSLPFYPFLYFSLNFLFSFQLFLLFSNNFSPNFLYSFQFFQFSPNNTLSPHTFPNYLIFSLFSFFSLLFPFFPFFLLSSFLFSFPPFASFFSFPPYFPHFFFFIFFHAIHKFFIRGGGGRNVISVPCHCDSQVIRFDSIRLKSKIIVYSPNTINTKYLHKIRNIGGNSGQRWQQKDYTISLD